MREDEGLNCGRSETVRTTSGNPLKWLSIVDEFTRECLALKVSRSITSEDVIDTLAELFAMYGVPRHFRSDNGPEFVAKSMRSWLERIGVGALFVEPGSPWKNGYAESFHSRGWDELLASEEFESLSAERSLTHRWREDYNQVRPHSSLGYVARGVFATRWIASVPERTSAKSQPAPALQQHTPHTPLPNPYPHNAGTSFRGRSGGREFVRSIRQWLHKPEKSSELHKRRSADQARNALYNS